MQLRLGTRSLATIAAFAALYALLDLIPVSRLVGNITFLTMAETFSPLAGMVLGPFEGGVSVVIGTFAATALGKPLGFDGLDFIPGVAAAVTGGLAFRGNVKGTAALSLAMFAAYMVSPLSAPFVSVGGVPVPYLWMHFLSLAVFVAVSYLRASGWRPMSWEVSIASVVFVSTMNAHVAGALMTEYVYVYVDHIYTAASIVGLWSIVFYLYPVERAFFTIVGSIIAVGVLRAIPPDTLSRLRGNAYRNLERM